MHKSRVRVIIETCIVLLDEYFEDIIRRHEKELIARAHEYTCIEEVVDAVKQALANDDEDEEHWEETGAEASDEIIKAFVLVPEEIRCDELIQDVSTAINGFIAHISELFQKYGLTVPEQEDQVNPRSQSGIALFERLMRGTKPPGP